MMNHSHHHNVSNVREKGRRSIRLKGYDYTCEGSFYITLCTNNGRCLFGRIVDGKMVLNEFGKIVRDQWLGIRKRFNNVKLDEFVVMPNHFHGIFHITPNNRPIIVGATLAVAHTGETGEKPPSVSDVVGAFKSLCVNRCLNWIKQNDTKRFFGKLWQRNYWEHIIRNDTELKRIRRYIRNNPEQWEKDSLKKRETTI